MGREMEAWISLVQQMNLSLSLSIYSSLYLSLRFSIYVFRVWNARLVTVVYSSTNLAIGVFLALELSAH